ncbi:MAG TPA: AsmA family protein, partial [Burkholderiales bacterium]|nr:AsmA family protein [Burkholderiales bacterium]
AVSIIASKLKRRLAWTLGGIVVAAAALIALAPLLIDARAVQAELQRRLSDALGGQVSWQELDVRLLPAPRGELRALRIDVPGKLEASADAVDVHLRLWPLLRGQPEISSITVERPRIRVAPRGDAPEEQKPIDVMALYRAVMEPAANALQDFAPRMELQLNEAVVAVGEQFMLRDLRARARTDSKGVELEGSSAATLWRRLTVQARFEYADLSARASAVVEGLSFDKDIPAAALRADVRTDGRSALECDFDGSVGTLVPAVKGKLLAAAGKPLELAADLGGMDMPQALALARAKHLPLDLMESAEGKISLAATAVVQEPWRADVSLVKSDAAIKLAALPWKISPRAARVAVTRERVTVSGLEGFIEKSAFSAVQADIDLETNRLASASGRARLELAQWLPWLKKTLPLEEIASLSGEADVALDRLALAFDRPAAADFDVLVTPRKVRAAVKALPVPVSVTSGSVRAASRRILLQNLAGSLGNSPFSSLTAQIDLGKTPRVSSASARASLRLDQWFPWLREKLPLQDVASVSGQADVTLNRLALRFDRPAEAEFDAVVTPRKVSAAVKALPVPVRVTGGSVRAGRSRVLLRDLEGSLGASAFGNLNAQIELGKTPLVSSASGRASVQLEQWFPWLKGALLFEDVAALSGSVDVTLHRLALRFDRPAELDYEADATLRHVSMTLKALPGALGIASGSMRFGRERARYEKLAVAMLDARALLSGTATIQGPRIELALDQGELGEKAMRWALELAKAPPRLEPRTPLRFAARRIAWSPDEGLEADARIHFGGGPALGIALAWRPELLDVRRLTIKDARSDALFSSRVADKRIEASFTGTLHGGSIAAMLKSTPADSGIAQGELRLTMDRKAPQNSIAQGKIQLQALDLTWLTGRKVQIERVSLSAAG